MKKQISKLLIVGVLACMLVGCGNQQGTNSTTTEQQTTTPTEEPTEPPHEHAYTEAITTEATCEADGVKTFTCECGDSYTEVITATGHSYGDYVYNNDATYEADGTETATCVCGLTDTRTASGTKLELPAEPNMYGMGLRTDIYDRKSWYCMEETDIYFEPSFQGPVVGHISINEMFTLISVTDNFGESVYTILPYSKKESPTEVGWIYIDYNGQNGFIPDGYMGREKRDTSVTLNPLAANYPLVGGGGNTTFYIRSGIGWRYLYGATRCSTVTLNTHYSSVDIYDGIDRNVIATITDANTKFQLTGNAYVTYRDDVASYYIYEIYYNGGVAYIDSLQSQQWN